MVPSRPLPFNICTVNRRGISSRLNSLVKNIRAYNNMLLYNNRFEKNFYRYLHIQLNKNLLTNEGFLQLNLFFNKNNRYLEESNNRLESKYLNLP